MSKPRRMQRGFTLVELLVVIAIIGVLVALLLPAVQAAREAARRMSCSNNMKNLVLALHNYADANKQFPIGTRSNGTGTSGSYANSWTVGILPYIEQSAMYDVWSQNPTGWQANDPKRVVHKVLIAAMRCPSSPLDKFVKPGGSVTPWGQTSGSETLEVMISNYVGIAGCTDTGDSTAPSGSGVSQWSFSAGSFAFAQGKKSTGTGIVSANGVLHPESQVGFGELSRDGASNTIFIGEQSDFMKSGNTMVNATSSHPNGAFAGSEKPFIPNGTAWSGSTHAVTTVRYPINFKYSDSGAGTSAGGLNCGIQSAHGGGAMLGWGDGRVTFTSESLDMTMLFRMCSKEDGQVVQLPDR